MLLTFYRYRIALVLLLLLSSTACLSRPKYGRRSDNSEFRPLMNATYKEFGVENIKIYRESHDVLEIIVVDSPLFHLPEADRKAKVAQIAVYVAQHCKPAREFKQIVVRVEYWEIHPFFNKTPHAEYPFDLATLLNRLKESGN